jgi:hypothetical protein
VNRLEIEPVGVRVGVMELSCSLCLFNKERGKEAIYFRDNYCFNPRYA